MQNTYNINLSASDLPGNPECPVCGGIGYLRLEMPVGHPDFGRIQPCECLRPRLNQRARQRLYTLSNLEMLKNKTFETFDARGRIGLGSFQADSLERAYNQAWQFAQNLKGWLLLQGRFGSGKTHLAAAIANYAVNLGISTLFITVPDMLDSLRFAYGNHETSFEEHFEEVRTVPLLVLDDFGTQNATPWAQEKLFQILNYRYINQLPLVVTTNLALEEVEGRIQSRLTDPDLVTRVTIISPDYRNPTDDIGHANISSLDLHQKNTFGNFSDRRSEKLPADVLQSLDSAFQAAHKFAENPQGWLIFTGSNGNGKTHLAASIANYRTGLGNPPVFISVTGLLDHLRSTFAPSSTVRFDRLFEEVRTGSLLILDDLNTQNMTSWSREKLYQIFDYRYYTELPTIITTSEEIERIDAKLRSRLLDTRLCSIIAIMAPSYTGAVRKVATRINKTKLTGR